MKDPPRRGDRAPRTVRGPRIRKYGVIYVLPKSGGAELDPRLRKFKPFGKTPLHAALTQGLTWGGVLLFGGENMANHTIKGCGNPKYRHGMSGTRLYRIWKSMKTRATNPRRKEASRYVLRGIGICREWRDDFIVFMDWALSNGYDHDLTIDRIDIDRGYSPDNCRWIVSSEQQSNRSTNRAVEFDGKVYPTVKSAAEHFGLSRKVLQHRLNRGWSIERALKQRARRSNGRT